MQDARKALKALGWRADGAADAPDGQNHGQLGRVSGQARGLYRVLTAGGEAEASGAAPLREFPARVTGRLLRAAVPEAAAPGGSPPAAVGAERLAPDPAALPVVGDWVRCQGTDAGALTIAAVLPRRSLLVRAAPDGRGAQPLAANVDVVCVIEALERGANLRRIERLLAAAWASGAEPAVLLSKADTHADLPGAQADVAAVAGAAPVLTVSAMSGHGLDAVRALLVPHRTGVLVGPSGVGKSTLINRLLGEETQPVGAVRADDGKGRHTTTARALLVLPGGGVLIDTPGIREYGLGGAGAALNAVYGDVEALAAGCRFRDCRHEGEPGCAVEAAVRAGALPEERLHSFRKLAREAAWHERRRDPRLAREHQREFARLIAAVKRDRKRFEW